MIHEDNNHSFHIRLVPEEKGFHLKLSELYHYRDLVILLTKKSFAVTYQQTVLGPLWIIFQPILSSMIYLFVFGHIAEIGTAGIPHILFYFVSSALWEIFSFSLLSNASTFVNNSNLFSKVYFPRLAVPVSNMFVSLLKFCIQMIIMAGLMVYFLAGGMISPHWTWYPVLPLIFLQISLSGMSAGILLSSLTTKYRDLSHLVNIGVSFFMYASPVVYPLSEIPEGPMKYLMKINPVSEPLELIRLIMFGKGEFDLFYYLGSLIITILMFLISTVVFNRVERTFADTV